MYAGALLLGAWSMVPLYWMLCMSVMHKAEIVSVPAHLVPHQPTLSNFAVIFDLPAFGMQGEPLPRLGQAWVLMLGLRNSVLVAVPVTIITAVIALPMAYALARLQFRFKSGLLVALLSARSYPPIATIIPFSWLFFQVGLQGTISGLILVQLTGTIPLCAWIMSGVFAMLPRNVEAAARVDGLTRFGALYKIMIPLAMPGVSACAVIAFMICWNEFAFAYLLTAGAPWAQTYPPLLPNFFFMVANTNLFAAVSIVGMLPPMILATVFQRRISSLNFVNPIS